MHHTPSTRLQEKTYLAGRVNIMPENIIFFSKSLKRLLTITYVYTFNFSAVKDDFLHLVRPVTDPVMPWTGYFTGIVIGSIWYWCADQVKKQI